VAVRGSHQALAGWNQEFKGGDAAARVVSREQEANGAGSDWDHLVAGIDVEV